MRISYLLTADALNQLADGRLNLLGANWTSVTVPHIPWTLPLAVAFGVEGSEDEAGSYRALVDLDEPTGKHTVIVDETVEITKVEGPEGVPGVSLGGLFDGRLEVEAAGLHRVSVQIGNAQAQTVFVVHDRSAGSRDAERGLPDKKPSRSGRRGKRSPAK